MSSPSLAHVFRALAILSAPDIDRMKSERVAEPPKKKETGVL
jgi:hypothetical protein